MFVVLGVVVVVVVVVVCVCVCVREYVRVCVCACVCVCNNVCVLYILFFFLECISCAHARATTSRI